MLNDPKLQELTEIIDDASEEISDNLSEMAFGSAVLLLLLYRRIQQKLQDTSRKVAVWADNYFAEIAEKTALVVSSPAEAETIVENEKAKFLTAMAVATSSILALAARMSRGQLPATKLGSQIRALRVQQVTAETTAKIAQARLEIRKLLHNGLVQLIGSTQRTSAYAFDYYAALQAHQARQLILNQAAVRDVVAAGGDLVQVSPNASTIGDFCNQYKGKVFSVTGAHPFFHSLEVMPNGGCPMHPWCRHVLLPFDETVKRSEQELLNLQYIPEDFLELGRRHATANEFQKLWLGS